MCNINIIIRIQALRDAFIQIRGEVFLVLCGVESVGTDGLTL